MEAEVWWYREPAKALFSEDVGEKCLHAQNKDLEGNMVAKTCLYRILSLPGT